MYWTLKALHPVWPPELASRHQHLVGLRGAGTHDLCIFSGEVVILQQVVQQTLSVSDVSDQMLPVDFQQLNEGVRLWWDYFHLTAAVLFHG